MYVVQGLGSTLADAVGRWTGPEPDARLGKESVAVALDLDGDGLNDLVSACQGCDDIYVVSGPATGSGPISEPAAATLVMEGDGDLPTAVASGGDLDDDGFGEILVGAFAVDDPWGGVGAVYLLAGPLSGSASVTEGLTWRGEDPDDNAGSSAVLVDFEGAGRPLLAVGAPNRTEWEDRESTGVVYLIDL